MKKQLLLLTILAVFTSQAQNNRFWKSHDSSSAKITTDKGVSRSSFPKEFKLFDLDADLLKQTLFSGNENKASQGKIIISLPNSDGQIEEYEIYEASNFEPALQAKFPEIRAYSGKGITDKYATLKLSISPEGIQTMVFRTDRENEFIEPYSQDHKVYAVFKSQREKGKLGWSCSTDDKNMFNDISLKITNTNKISDGTLRTMRLAQSCTGEYAAYFGASTAGTLSDQSKVLAAFNATLTRCNGVYEKDLALHLNLIAETVNVIFYDASTDPYSAASVGTASANSNNATGWNIQLQNTLSSLLTGAGSTLAANNAVYDIGHLFGGSGGGGNAGCIGCVCVNDTAGDNKNKGSGYTSPGDAIPQGDNFDIDYVVHEVGHQLGANHTFSNGNEGAGVNKEVGSGITIMGYAGITSYDIAPHSIDIYHQASIQQIQANLATKTCPVLTNISANNSTPVVSPVSNYTIPKSTPFVLTGSATDANVNDALTFCWEQNDDGGTSIDAASSASTTKVVGPNFISKTPTAVPFRYFPQLSSILANSATTSQVGGDAGMLSEALSSVSRDLNFRLTVRDNAPYSSVSPVKVGQTAFTDMKVTVDGTAGPFVLTTPNTVNEQWFVGSNETVTWNVAGTNTGLVNTPFVDVLLSIDGGNTYPIVLATNVANDGSETIVVPNNVGTNNRVMVKAKGNIFFDISNANFAITNTPTFSITSITAQNVYACSDAATINIDYKTTGPFTDVTSFNVTGTPSGSTAIFNPATINATGSVALTISNLLSVPAGLYPITVNATSGATTRSISYNLYVGVGSLTLTSPADNAINQNTALKLTWTTSTNATSYDVQVASDIAFTTIVRSGNVTTNSYNVSGLVQDTNYYWRVLPKNSSCSGAYGAVFKFKIGVITCTTSANGPTLAIPATLTAVFNGTSTLNIPSGVSIADINVNLNISHTWVNDLRVTLTSPSNTVVTLFNRQCDAALGNEDVNAVFDDSGSAIVCNQGPTPAGISGTVIPLQALSAFNGQNSAGNWVLSVRDSFDGDGGSVNSWSLNICSLNTSLGIVENQFSDFSLFPNPNNGDFTVKLTSQSSNNIKINVHDISGRQVYEKSFANTGTFDQNINLDKIQAGVYLVSIADGDKKTVKRIVIE